MGNKIREPRVVKIANTPNYGTVFSVNLPVRFFFNEDGSYDGIEVHVEHATPNEQALITELCQMLRDARGK